MKTIVDYINENINITESSHEADYVANKIMKGIVNKKMSLDELSELLADEGWEFEDEVKGEHGENDTLIYSCNFTNNAEGDCDFLDIEVKKEGNMYKILNYTLE